MCDLINLNVRRVRESERSELSVRRKNWWKGEKKQ